LFFGNQLIAYGENISQLLQGAVLRIDMNGNFKSLLKIEGESGINNSCSGISNISIDKDDNLYWTDNDINISEFGYNGNTVSGSNAILKIDTNDEFQWIKTVDIDKSSTSAFYFLSPIWHNGNCLTFTDDLINIPYEHSGGMNWAGDSIYFYSHFGILRCEANANELSFGCDQIETNAGIEYLKEKNAINIFPNPSTGEIYVDVSNFIGADIRIFDINGITVYYKNSFSEKSTKLNINLPSGIYLLQVQLDGKIETKKIVIK
jgi:hypothetical protein